ncbi:MAG: acyltransferase [Chloroflexi bacterium]|nr:MAG: acyltransferase [Chloroflexota bacterium]RLT34223.1 MAG: acyltransferase [Chloroflexota bacterium]
MYTFFLVWVVLISSCIALRLGKSFYVLGLVVTVAGVLILIPSLVKIVALTLTIGWLVLSIVQMLAGLNQRTARDDEHAPTPTPDQHKYRPEIDGLRAFAIIPVVIYHAFPSLMPGGFIGVDIFFVISGFLITQILIEQNAKGTFTYIGFYERRIRRIFPALVVVLATVLVMGWFVLFPAEYENLIRQSIAGSLFVSNILLYSQVGYFAQDSYALPLLHLWSLGIEEQFYIVWPVVITLLRKHRNGLFWTFLLLCIASFVTTQYLHKTDDDAAFYWPISRFWELGIGGIAAWIVSTYRIPYTQPQVRKIASELSWAGFILLCIGFVVIKDKTVFPGNMALIPTVGAFMLIVSGGQSWVSRVLFANKFVVFVGLISYPLYLWHWPILSFGMLYLEADFTAYLRIGAIILSVVLAFLTYWVVERRVRETREQAKLVPTWLILVTMLGVVMSAAVFLQWPIPTVVSAQLNTQTAKTTLAKIAARTNIQTCMQAGFKTSFRANCNLVAHPDSTRTQYIVIGDSIAKAFATALLDQTIDHPVLVMRKNGCIPLPGMERYGASDAVSVKCNVPRGIPAIYETLKTMPADRDRVIFVLGRYTSIEGYKPNPQSRRVIRLKYRDRPFPETSEQKQTDYRDSLVEMFDRLTALPRTKVVFVYQTPEFPFAPNTCLRRNTLPGSWACPVPRAFVDAFNAQYRNIVEEVLPLYPQIDTIDPMQMMCDTENCYAAKDGQLLFSDDTHMNVHGAQLLTAGITERYP